MIMSISEDLYRSVGQGEDSRLRLFNEHIPQVVKTAGIFRSKLPADGLIVDQDDFETIGLVALWACTETYDPSVGDFWPYAAIRVKGAMFDELRRIDFVPRTARELSSRTQRRCEEMSKELGRDVGLSEAATDLGLSRNDLSDIMFVSDLGFFSINDSAGNWDDAPSLQEIIPDERTEDAIELSIQSEDCEIIAECLDLLPVIQRSIIRMHFWNGISHVAIGKAMGISESRVCQIFNQGLGTLQKHLDKARKK